MRRRTAAGNDGYTEYELLRMIRKWVPRERVPKRVRIKDTSDFFRVDYDDVAVLGSIPYFIGNNEIIHEAKNCAVWVVE